MIILVVDQHLLFIIFDMFYDIYSVIYQLSHHMCTVHQKKKHATQKFIHTE